MSEINRLPRRRLLAAIASTGLVLSGCGFSSDDDGDGPLVVSASSVPHAEILREVEELGLLGETTLEIKEATGDVDPNQLLVAGDVDANYFQHVPYEKDWEAQHGSAELVDVAAVHVEPLGLYSQKAERPEDLPTGATIALPNNVTNFARGLILLQEAGLITLDEEAASGDEVTQVTKASIAENPKQLTFVEVDPAQLPRTLSDGKVGAAVINGNYALEAQLVPSEDAIAIEPADDNPYANVLTTLPENESDPRVQELAEALTSSQIQDWISSTYSGSVVPVGGDA